MLVYLKTGIDIADYEMFLVVDREDLKWPLAPYSTFLVYWYMYVAHRQMNEPKLWYPHATEYRHSLFKDQIVIL